MHGRLLTPVCAAALPTTVAEVHQYLADDAQHPKSPGAVTP